MKLDWIHTYLVVVFSLVAIGVVVKLLLLSTAEYPRIVKWRRGEDVFSLVMQLGSLVLTAYMLGWIRF